ncbi:hypothetical protein Tco_1576326, partial [Tanacetum coccineum]
MGRSTNGWAPSFSPTRRPGSSGSCSSDNSSGSRYARNKKPVSMQYKLSDGPPPSRDFDTEVVHRGFSTSFVDRVPSRFSEGGYSRQSSMITSAAKAPSYNRNIRRQQQRKPSHNSVHEATTTSPADNQQPIKSYSSMKQPFKQNPLYTMTKLEQYIHSPEEKLLTQFVKKNLEEMIHPAIIRDQMDPISFKFFSETIFNCLKEKRTERPNIDDILRNLENALAHQMKHNNHDQSVIPGEDQPTLISSHVEMDDENEFP